MNYLELLKIELPASQKAVFMAIAIRQGSNTTAHPSVKCLAKDTGLNPRTVQRALRALEEAGHIKTCFESLRVSKYKVTSKKRDTMSPPPGIVSPPLPAQCHPEVSNRNLNINTSIRLSKESAAQNDQNPISFKYGNDDKELQIQDERERKMRKLAEYEAKTKKRDFSIIDELGLKPLFSINRREKCG